MTVAKLDAPVYTDLAGLGALRRGAANNDPATIRKVAEQFESMFTRMMLKSMRDAVGPDPMFGSNQQQMYQDMADDQLSLELSKGRGLGLADMLVKQLQKMGVQGAAGARGSLGPTARTAAAAYTAAQGASGTAPTDAEKAQFVRDLWPHAQQAGAQLGVDPRNVIAQAALETNWGRSVPQDGAGRSSHNLFGIKASSAWSGGQVTSGTREFQGGSATSTLAQFRSYATPAQSFQDYVALLRENPRYSAALNTGADVDAFAGALQQGGYATDPDYAAKISAIAHKVSSTLQAARQPAGGSGPGAADLKLASGVPISGGTGAL